MDTVKIINVEENPKGGVPRVAYKFRSECAYDCDRIRLILAPWIVTWHEDANYLDSPHGFGYVPDREVYMELQAIEIGLSLEQVRWLLHHFEDLHVVTDTIAYAESYTGDRTYDIEHRTITTPEQPVLARIIRHLTTSGPMQVNVGSTLSEVGGRIDIKHLQMRYKYLLLDNMEG